LYNGAQLKRGATVIKRATFQLVSCVLLAGSVYAQPAQPAQPAAPSQGIPVTDQLTRTKCVSCHASDARDQMTRISYMRKTPEGWQETIKRMVRESGLQIEPADARAIVKYLSNHHGLTPEEARLGFYEVEKRVVVERIPDELDRTCRRCHSLGRIFSQRRTREDWQLLANMHVAVFPLSEGQGNFVQNPNVPNPIILPTVEDLRREVNSPRPGPIPTAPPEMTAGGGGRGGRGGGGPGGGGDDGGGLERALDYLNRNLALDNPKWTAWRANFRYPRLEGTWLVEAYLPGRGRGFGQMTIERETAEDEYRTRTTIEFQDGEKTTRTGRVILYGGYSWRGSSSDSASSNAQLKDLREVMLLSDDLECGDVWAYARAGHRGRGCRARSLDPRKPGVSAERKPKESRRDLDWRDGGHQPGLYHHSAQPAEPPVQCPPVLQRVQ